MAASSCESPVQQQRAVTYTNPKRFKMKTIKRFETFSCAVNFLKESNSMTFHEAAHYVWDNGYKVPGDSFLQVPMPE